MLIPHVLAYNQAAVPAAAAAVARALGAADDPARALWNLARSLDAPRSLAELGLDEGALRGSRTRSSPGPTRTLSRRRERAWSASCTAHGAAAPRCGERESPRLQSHFHGGADCQEGSTQAVAP